MGAFEHRNEISSLRQFGRCSLGVSFAPFDVNVASLIKSSRFRSLWANQADRVALRNEKCVVKERVKVVVIVELRRANRFSNDMVALDAE